MKRAKKLTQEQKFLLSVQGFKPEEWLLIGDDPDKLVVLKRDGSAMTVVPKPRKPAVRR